MQHGLVEDEPNTDPVELPISYRLCGQRFIIDSYIFSNVVYDRIVAGWPVNHDAAYRAVQLGTAGV